MYKIGGVVLNGTDSIIISFFVEISVVGLYRYLLVVNVFKKVLLDVFSGVVASVGNLNATRGKGKGRKAYSWFIC